MKPILAAVVATAGAVAGPSLAGADTIATYYAAFGPQDFYNSNGQPLRDFAAILQQDRANYHRFGRRDAYDDGDPVFGNQAVRAQIPALFAAYGPNAWWTQHAWGPSGAAPVEADVLVVVCGSGGRLTHLIVNHANGDGYTYC